MTTSPIHQTIRKLNDRRSLFVIAALSIALISAVVRLFAEPGRPAIAVVADVAILALILVINVFSLIVVFRASKAIMTEPEFADVRQVAYNVKHPNDGEQARRAAQGVSGYGATTRKMTPDELEAAGLPRDFHAGRP